MEKCSHSSAPLFNWPCLKPDPQQVWFREAREGVRAIYAWRHFEEGDIEQWSCNRTMLLATWVLATIRQYSFLTLAGPPGMVHGEKWLEPRTRPETGSSPCQPLPAGCPLEYCGPAVCWNTVDSSQCTLTSPKGLCVQPPRPQSLIITGEGGSAYIEGVCTTIGFSQETASFKH